MCCADGVYVCVWCKKHGDVDWNAVGGNHLALKDGDNSTACGMLKSVDRMTIL